MDRPIALDLLLTAGALVGHFSLAIWLFNRLHASAWPRKAIKWLEKVLLLGAAAMLVWLIAGWLGHVGSGWLLAGYSAACWAAALAVVPLWLVPKLGERMPAALASNDTNYVEISERLGFDPVHGTTAQWLARVPGNEIFHLAVQQKSLELGRLPAELDGLSIAHLSDLHITGHLGREFYDVVVAEANALAPDFVVITGDILDNDACRPWIVPVLGQLKARQGKYFILGNHEMGLGDVPALRAALVEAGFVDLGSRCERVAVRGTELLLAGNERPWFGTLPVLPARSNSEFRFQISEFRILLAHTPDQLPWAKANGFDLMLAGHNHGGQIRLPYLGALISPSRYGFRYAGGLYQEEPTLLHVSRGISGVQTIRLNCPPELALLILRTAKRSEQ